jgi:hypothetical protein
VQAHLGCVLNKTDDRFLKCNRQSLSDRGLRPVARFFLRTDTALSDSRALSAATLLTVNESDGEHYRTQPEQFAVPAHGNRRLDRGYIQSGINRSYPKPLNDDAGERVAPRHM